MVKKTNANKCRALFCVQLKKQKTNPFWVFPMWFSLSPVKYPNLRKIPWDKRKIRELTLNPVRNILKIRELTQNRARVTRTISRTYAKYANHIRKIREPHTQNTRKIRETISRIYAKYANHIRKIREKYANHLAYVREPFRVCTRTISRAYAKLTRNQLVPRWQSTSHIFCILGLIGP